MKTLNLKMCKHVYPIILKFIILQLIYFLGYYEIELIGLHYIN